MKTTRRILHYSNGITSLALIAMVLPVGAIEKPAEQENPKDETRIQTQEDALPRHPQIGEHQPKLKQIAWVGIGGSPASEPLSKHLGLEAGNGLTIFHVCPQSAAAKADIRTHDVITQFDGKKIGSIEELRDAVLARSPGDEVTIKLIHEGKAIEKQVVLGGRTEGAAHHHLHPQQDVDPRWRGMGHLPQVERERLDQAMEQHFDEMKKFLDNDDGLALDLNDLLDLKDLMDSLPGDQRDRIRQMLHGKGEDWAALELQVGDATKQRIKKSREQALDALKKIKEADEVNQNQAQIERLQNSIKNLEEGLKRIEEVEALFGGNKAGLKLGAMQLQDMLKHGQELEQPKQNLFNFKAQASVSLMDNEGSVTIKTINGKKEVIVKDRSGKVLFEGPYQNDQDKAAVPDEYRERIEAFNFSGIEQR